MVKECFSDHPDCRSGSRTMSLEVSHVQLSASGFQVSQIAGLHCSADCGITALSQEHLTTRGVKRKRVPRLALFPFAFYNDMIGASVALAAVTSNWPQPQSSLFLTTFVSNLGT